MFKMLSEKLNIQFIIVTHINELKERANNIFEIRIEKGVSKNVCIS
jgi:chromosome segregation ATPase